MPEGAKGGVKGDNMMSAGLWGGFQVQATPTLTCGSSEWGLGAAGRQEWVTEVEDRRTARDARQPWDPRLSRGRAQSTPEPRPETSREEGPVMAGDTHPVGRAYLLPLLF